MKKIKDVFNQSFIKVPTFQPWITRQDKNAVLESLNNALLTDGPRLRKFESIFSNFTGSRYAVGVSSGTAALHLSLKALGIGKGDEVIVPDLTFVATGNSVLLSGATPVLVDIDGEQFGISIRSIQEKISSKTKAIMPVHFAGESCRIAEICDLAKSNGLHVIEDCAHAIGTYHKGKHVGTFGVTGCFSFYPTKNITSVEGGMVITNSYKIAEKIRRYRNHGITKTLSQRYTSNFPWSYDVIESGYNYRLDEVRSSLGISQLKRINRINKMRKRAVMFYNFHLSKIEGIITPKLVNDDSHSYHLYIIRVKKNYGLSRNGLFKALFKNGIRTTVHYKPLHKFTVFKKFVKNLGNFPNTNKAYSEIITLPLFPTISRRQQLAVIKCIQENKGR